jgi:murein DD-endopeptidase MepM/ murein hydrolase activator NlpD
MIRDRLHDLRLWIADVFPERHVYMRTGSETCGFVVTTRTQARVAAAAALLMAWLVIATTALAVQPFIQRADESLAAKTERYYGRLIADRQARLDAAMARLNAGAGDIRGVADEVLRRHEALAMLLTAVKGVPLGDAAETAAVTPINLASLKALSPLGQMRAVLGDQERILGVTEDFARSRADRLRMAFRLAGVEPSAAGRATGGGGLGGPLIEAKDPAALAAVLDVDTGFAARIQHAARNLTVAQSLSAAADQLPLAKPVSAPMKTSGFGARIDPFTHHGAFHPGQDFAGDAMTPVLSTAPGVVAFTGQRTGYGNVVEIDHGGGFKTRYAHLQTISVAMGQHVGVGQRIGGMGSTGRSTGVHLHYEVWKNGRVQDPTRFLKAGDYVQQDE